MFDDIFLARFLEEINLFLSINFVENYLYFVMKIEIINCRGFLFSSNLSPVGRQPIVK